jgi:hypothetical protein
MWTTKVLLFLLLAMIAGGLAQTVGNPVRIYTNPSGVRIKAIGAAMTTCSVTLVILDDSAQCVKMANANGEVYNTACTPAMSTAFDMFIYASAGYIINSAGQLIIMDMYSAATLDVIGVAQTKAVQPFKIGLYTGFGVPTATHTWVLADGAVNSTIYLPNWTINGFKDGSNIGTSNSYGSSLITQLNNTLPIKCLFSTQGGVFMVVYENSNYVEVYAWSAASASSPANQKYLRTLRGFGTIGACGTDFYNRAWIYDTSVNAVKVIDQNGVLAFQTQLPGAVNPRKIEVTRDKVFVLDDFGVIRYDLPALSVVITPPANPTCATSPLKVVVTNGAGGYTLRVAPDQLTGSTTNNALTYTFTGNLPTRPAYSTPFYLYDDDVAPEFLFVSAGVGSASTPASVFPPYAGSKTISMLIANEYSYRITTNSLIAGASISASLFETLELQVNPGDGVGKFKIDLGTGTNYKYFEYSNLPANTWTKISINLSNGPSATYSQIVFNDLSKSASTTSFLYVDNIRLLPYSSTARRVIVRDLCNNTYTSDPIPVDETNKLTASIAATPDACTPQDDWNVSAVVSGGVSPYTYVWTGSSGTTSSVKVTSLGSNIVLYDNALNSSFSDESSGSANLADSTYYRSAPYSASMQPDGLGSTIILFTPAGLSSTKYQSVEFWVNGGEHGGQIIYAGLVSPQFTMLSPTLVHRLLGFPSIPPNTWVKVTYPIPASAGTFYGFVLLGVEGLDQPKIYFDDIQFKNNEFTLTVTDAASCKVTTNSISVSDPTARDATFVQTASNIWQENGKFYSQWQVTLQNGAAALYNVRFSVSGTLRNIWSVVSEGGSAYSLPSYAYTNGKFPPSSSYSFGYIIEGYNSADIAFLPSNCNANECSVTVVNQLTGSWGTSQQYGLTVTNTGSRTAATAKFTLNLPAGATISSKWNINPTGVANQYECLLWNISPGQSNSGCGYIINTPSGGSASVSNTEGVCV